MVKIYSKVDPTLLLHIVFREEDFNKERTEIIDADNFLQCAALRFDEGRSFRPHKHIEVDVTYTKKKAQEAWVVMRGVLRVSFYDIDDSILEESTLFTGDACFTLHGGHTFEILQNNSFIFEFKTGPYLGQTLDKTFIDA